MWFWLSLIAVLFWSGSDFFSKAGSPPEDKNSHWKMVMAVGLFMGGHATVELLRGTPFTGRDILVYLPVSALYIAAMIFGYVGLRHIELSISTPICNSSGAVAAVLMFFFMKETLAAVQWVAVALIVVAIYLLTMLERSESAGTGTLTHSSQGNTGSVSSGKNESVYPSPMTHSASATIQQLPWLAIFFSILYCIIDGLGTFADAYVLDNFISEDSANIAYEYTFFILGVLAFFYVRFYRGEKIVIAKERPKLLAGVCETAGQYAYIFALGDNPIASAPLISSYCVFSILWARIFLKEKLTWKQYAVIALAVVGIIILGAEGE